MVSPVTFAESVRQCGSFNVMSVMSHHFDILIAGAGPAGAAAALTLARAGRVRVGVFDQARLPRHKPCGGVFAARLLDALGKDCDLPIERTTNVLEYTNRGEAPRELTETTCAVDRSAFDYALLQHAVALAKGDVTVLEEFRLASVKETEDDVTVTGSCGRALTARVLIGADGAFSRVARSTGLDARRVVRPAIDVELKVPDPWLARFEDRLTLDLFEVPDGYGWIFPKRESLSCGVLSWSGSANLNTYLRRYLERRLHDGWSVVRQMGHGIPTYTAHKAIATRRVLLAGDAAHLADPIYGAGIETAIESGQLAGETAHAMCCGGEIPDRLAMHYQAEIRRRIGDPFLAVSKFVSPIFRDKPTYFYERFLCGHTSYEQYASQLAAVHVRPAIGG